jgi:murein L,D-transpeptidase YcbB/YkuD
MSILSHAADDGLESARYDVDGTRDVVTRAADPEAVAAADVHVSRVAIRYARDLALGRVRPRDIDVGWTSANSFDPVAALGAALDWGTVASLPDRLRPPHPGYADLRSTLQEYRAQAASSEDSARVRLIELNLERWRWLPRDLGRRHILIDVAAFRAVAVDEHTEALQTRIVTGRAGWPTPIVSGQLRAVVANPAWNVPHDIAVQEILPALRRDGGFLAREGMAVYRNRKPVDPQSVEWAAVTDSAFPFRLVQAPGPRNPLGRVKLVFLNPFNVALHDTPSRSLFSHAERAGSHGCIRVEHAVELALWAVGPSRRDALRRALALSDERTLALGEQVDVHLVYFTAWVGANAELQVRPDIYGWDTRLARALER